MFVFFFCSHWSFVDDVPLIFFCPADHVPDWQPRILLGMVEARSVNVKKTTTTCWSFLDYVEDIYLAGWSSSSFLLKKPLLPFVPLFTICITSPKTVYAIYSIYLIATL